MEEVILPTIDVVVTVRELIEMGATEAAQYAGLRKRLVEAGIPMTTDGWGKVNSVERGYLVVSANTSADMRFRWFDRSEHGH